MPDAVSAGQASSNGALHLELDVNRFTLGELEDLEDATGLSFSQVGEQLASGNYSAKVLRAMVWILRRRAEPKFTLEQARAVEVRNIVFEDAPTNRAERRAVAKRGERRPPV